VESSETPEEAIVREMHEELGLTLNPEALTPATFVSMPIYNRHLLMVLYVCTRFEGAAAGREKQRFAWVTFDELRAGKYEMSDSDASFATWVLEHLDPGSA